MCPDILPAKKWATLKSHLHIYPTHQITQAVRRRTLVRPITNSNSTKLYFPTLRQVVSCDFSTGVINHYLLFGGVEVVVKGACGVEDVWDVRSVAVIVGCCREDCWLYYFSLIFRYFSAPTQNRQTSERWKMSRLMRPPFIDPTTGVAYDTDKGDFEGYLTKQSMWLRVRTFSASSRGIYLWYVPSCWLLVIGLETSVFHPQGFAFILCKNSIRSSPRYDWFEPLYNRQVGRLEST